MPTPVFPGPIEIVLLILAAMLAVYLHYGKNGQRGGRR